MKNKILLIVGVIVISLFSNLSAQFSGAGSGISGDPYIITTPTQLDEVRNDITAYYELGNDIDLDVDPYNTGDGWNPIGGDFSGNFDGKGYTISNLFIDRTGDFKGLFKNISTSHEVTNFVLANVNITVDGRDSGALCAYIYDGTVSKIGIYGSVTGSNNIAGMAHYLGTPGVVEECYFSGTVESTSSGSERASGLINQSTGTIRNCFTTAEVTGNCPAGFVYQNGGTIEDCYTCSVVNRNTSAGNIFINSLTGGGSVSSSYANSDIAGSVPITGANGKTTEEMTLYDNNGTDPLNLYSGWDFTTIWGVDGSEGGYPYLKNIGNENTLYMGTIGTGSAFGAGKYNEGVYSAVYAETNNDNTFTKWTRTAAKAEIDVSTDNPFRYQILNVQNLNANFDRNTYTLTIEDSPSAGGTASDDTGAGPYISGTEVDISAAVNPGYEFVNWTSNNGGSFGNANSASTIFTTPIGNVTVTANYRQVYVLTTARNPEAGGTVSDDTGTGPYAESEEVDISASVNAGYEFLNWSSNNGGSFADSESASTTFTMPGGAVTVTGNFNKLPYYSGSPYSREIPEDAANSDNVGAVITASDDDGTISSYSITECKDGNDSVVGAASVFNINNSGQITVADNSKLDEETPAYSSYVLTIQAEDDDGGTCSAAVNIDVTNVNDDPYFTGTPYSREIPENASNGDNVGAAVTATDDDAGGSIVSYTIIGCLDGTVTPVGAASVFNIDNSGQITVVDNTKLDEETAAYSSYSLTVRAVDNEGGTCNGTVNISVININEPPVFLNTPYSALIQENTDKETVVCTLTAEDIDRAGPVKEKIEEYQNVYFDIISGNINDAFKIVLPVKGTESEHTAYVAVNKKYALDYETIPNHEFVLTVKAYDDGDPSAYATETVTITLEGVEEPPVIDDPSMTNIPGIVPPGDDDGGSGGGGNPPVTIIHEDETIIYYFNGYDPEGNLLSFVWKKNGQPAGTNSQYTFVPEPLKDGEKSREYTMNFIADDGSTKTALNAEWKIMVLNADNPIEVNSVAPAPNTSTDPSISTAGGSYNMTEGETLSFSVDADDPDGSLLWRNWYVNDELVWLDPDFDFNTHFMSSGGSPYDIKLYLQGQQGDYQEFHWTVNVSNKEVVTYANSPMILSGTAMIEGLNAESGDAIAAYLGDELRGEILLSNSNFDNFAINLAENNEEISFVIYDSDNNIIKTVHRTVNGEINTAQDITLHGYEKVSNSFVLAENWNYVSFNTIPEDNSVSSVFSNTNISEIRTSTEIYNPSNPEFLNTLKEIKPGIGYLVKMNSNSSIFVNGYSAENSEIELYEGWNLIGYTERSSSDIETAFGSVINKIIEIKSEVGVFSADMPAYMNTLSTIEKNKAYWVKCSEDCVLDFPSSEDKRNNSSYLENQDFNKVTSSFSAEGNGLRDTRSTSPTRPPVDVSFGNIAVRTNSFVVYAEIQNPSDNTLCAYNNNELRGISQIVENNNKYYTSIVVNSDIAGEKITLKIGDNTVKTISSIPGTTIGKDNLLQLDGSLENEIPASFKVSLFPNPFNPEINISFELPKAERINISVFDINGKLVKTLEDNVFNSGKHSITWNGTDSNNNKMASGIYFVKVKSDSYNTTEKIVMMK